MVLLVFTECEVKEMKDRNNPAVEYSVALKPASQEEAGLFYSDEKQDEVLGTVGHLRIDFGSGGKSFWSTWWPHNSDQFNTPEFKRELQQIVDTLRRNGPLQSLSAMSSYCWTHGGEISTNDRVYGYIAETEHYRFCLRCTPRPGDYQGYLYCYDLREQQMRQRERLVGRVTYANGEQQEFTDPQEYLRTIQEELPYYPSEWETGDKERNVEEADRLNERMGVTPAQRMAMEIGSMAGWDVPGADPKNYEIQRKEQIGGMTLD